MPTSPIDQQELLSLPHGPEFRFIHEITALDPGKSAQGTYHISGDEGFLRGHFPENPIWPGIIMVEAIAQLGGVAAQSDADQPKLKDIKLTAIKNVKILGTAKPGSTLIVEAKVEGRMGNLIQISGYVFEAADGGHITLAKGVVMLSGGEGGVTF